MDDLKKTFATLDRLDPPDLWADARGRLPRRTGPPESSPSRRVVAGIVAFAVFAAVAAFGWNAFRPTTGATHIFGPARGSALVLNVDAADQGAIPKATFSYGGARNTIPPQGGSLIRGANSIGYNLPGEIPAGTPIRVETDADAVTATASACCPAKRAMSLATAADPVGELPLDPGTYMLVFTVSWPDGTAEYTIFVDVLQAPTPAPSTSEPSSDAKLYLPPFFPSTDGWHVRDFGQVPRGAATGAWASNVPFDPRDLTDKAPAIPPYTIVALPSDGIVVTTEVTPWAFDPSEGAYPPGALDRLDLSKATLRAPTAEEPPGNYAVLEIPARYILVRVYFGTANPSAAMVAQAQSELDTLEIPPVCPVPSGPVFPQLSVTSGGPGTEVTVSGPVPQQGEDGSYIAPTGDMQVWWNFQGDLNDAGWTDLLPGGASPSPANEGVLTMVTHASIDGRCSWQATFAVPDVPPAAYPITVLSVGADSSSMAGPPLTFEVTGP
jgi:hypothetical protein